MLDTNRLQDRIPQAILLYGSALLLRQGDECDASYVSRKQGCIWPTTSPR